MARPRIHASNAAKQKAYRVRKLGDVPVEAVDAALAFRVERPEPKSCSAYCPRGTKCKLCGKAH